MGPSVKFVLPNRGLISKKNDVQFKKKKDYTGGPRGVWQKTVLFHIFFFLGTFPCVRKFIGVTFKFPICRWTNMDHSGTFGPFAYLILVSYATHGISMLFQAGILFSTGNAKGTALSKVYSDQI